MKRLEINLQDLLWTLKKHFLWILIATLLCGAGAWAYSKYLVTPMYTAKVSFCVVSSSRNNTPDISNSELVADVRLAYTYLDILQSNTVLGEVGASLDRPLTAGGVRAMIQPALVTDTQNLAVAVTSSDPQFAMDVGNALANIAPSAIQNIIKSGEMFVIDHATLPVAPTSPNVQFNTTLGLIFGLLASCILFVMIAIFDTTVRREEDLTRAFDTPVLGIVPGMSDTAHSNAPGYKRR